MADHRPPRRSLIPVAISVATTLIGGATWVETRYAKAADVDRLERALADLASDLRIGQLENHRAVLRGEQFQLKTAAHQATPLERQRLNEVENELHDVEQQLDRLRQGQKPK